MAGNTISVPEITSYPDNKHIAHGSNFILRCEANTEYVTGSWEKDGQRLHCLQGKHKVKHIGKIHAIEISNAEERDEGNYTLTLTNKSGTASCSAYVRIVLKEWRKVDWRQDGALEFIKTFQICGEVQDLRFLLFGPVGAGKSSTINTIRSILEERQFVNCLAAAGLSTSHTVTFQRYRFENQTGSFPFTFNDVMGAEQQTDALHLEDIITALKGHMKDGYEFNSISPLTAGNAYYNPNPTLNDQMHCLVYVIAADRLPLMEKDFFKKLGSVRETASRLRMPQVIFLTRIDLACPLVKENLQNVYKSKKIRDSMTKCSNQLNVPMNCIFPILNYSNENQISEHTNSLMLDALKNIVHFANDYVSTRSEDQSSPQHVICE